MIENNLFALFCIRNEISRTTEKKLLNSVEWGTTAARFASQLARNKSLYTEFDFNLLTMGKKCTRDSTDNSPRTYLYIKKEIKVLSERSTALPTNQLLLSVPLTVVTS